MAEGGYASGLWLSATKCPVQHGGLSQTQWVTEVGSDAYVAEGGSDWMLVPKCGCGVRQCMHR